MTRRRIQKRNREHKHAIKLKDTRMDENEVKLSNHSNIHVPPPIVTTHQSDNSGNILTTRELIRLGRWEEVNKRFTDS